jgi:hypothetical protein
MSSTGIRDPWRVVQPIEPPPRSANGPGKRIDVADIDLDADLAVPHYHVFRSRHGAVEVRSTAIETTGDALRELARLLAESWPTRGPEITAAGIGYWVDGDGRNVPADDAPLSALRAETPDAPNHAAIYFTGQTFDDGMRRLIRVLKKSNPPLLAKRGVTPMMR